MKYIFFFVGALMLTAGVQLAVNGATSEWDAGIAAVPISIGVLLIGAGVGLHIYDNWESKQ